MGRTQRLDRRRRSRLFHDLLNLDCRQPGVLPMPHRLAQPLSRPVLPPHPANRIGPRHDLDAALGMLFDDALPFEFSIRPRRRLRIGEQLLSKRAMIRQPRPRRQRPRRDVGHQLACDLFMNRYR